MSQSTQETVKRPASPPSAGAPGSASGKTVLSLFDYSGNWSLPYEEAGANVVRIDLKHGIDVMDLSATWLMENVMDNFGTVDAILAAVNEFQAGTAHFDDETLVVLRVL